MQYAILTAMLREQSYFVKEVTSRLPGLECSYGDFFYPGYGDLGRKERSW